MFCCWGFFLVVFWCVFLGVWGCFVFRGGWCLGVFYYYHFIATSCSCWWGRVGGGGVFVCLFLYLIFIFIYLFIIAVFFSTLKFDSISEIFTREGYVWGFYFYFTIRREYKGTTSLWAVWIATPQRGGGPIVYRVSLEWRSHAPWKWLVVSCRALVTINMQRCVHYFVIFFRAEINKNGDW